MKSSVRFNSIAALTRMVLFWWFFDGSWGSYDAWGLLSVWIWLDFVTGQRSFGHWSEQSFWNSTSRSDALLRDSFQSFRGSISGWWDSWWILDEFFVDSLWSLLMEVDQILSVMAGDQIVEWSTPDALHFNDFDEIDSAWCSCNIHFLLEAGGILLVDAWIS